MIKEFSLSFISFIFFVCCVFRCLHFIWTDIWHDIFLFVHWTATNIFRRHIFVFTSLQLVNYIYKHEPQLMLSLRLCRAVMVQHFWLHNPCSLFPLQIYTVIQNVSFLTLEYLISHMKSKQSDLFQYDFTNCY